MRYGEQIQPSSCGRTDPSAARWSGMRVLISGGRGQLAADLIRSFERNDIAAPGRDELDVTAPDAIDAAMERWQPDVVVNTAAFHKVDLCEEEPEQSFAVNAAAPQRLAAACRRREATLVHISTDYVFNGQKRAPYVEQDVVDPLSVYGASKAAGEMAVRCTLDRHILVRTTGLYGVGGMRTGHGNFVETMLRLGGEGRELSVVGDQILTPSYTRDVADIIARLVEIDAHGTFHVTNSGECSWYEFAAEIFRLSGQAATLSRTTQAERPVPARRPAYSVLGHGGLMRLGIPEPQPWRDALAAYLDERAGE